ncbi:hypothetical protein CAPTEDRAFT_229271 [Capitella teleta]|uniref:SAM domain-containing protein n=1 Tax=Capitella teleta TaxID=283909 RepID=R7UKY9_CAPTE|nr:hypothetical protein CAPTEDRAFT_229271 [Capitella teleta]|eukprot:ELU06905.1 hypothetical protein CAPTEDRAFT_229271 [Capitella teleta]
MANMDDMKDPRVPRCLNWSCEDVANFVEELGFGFYRDCFICNAISGRRLILMEASSLPSIGITDFEHIKTITKGFREQMLTDAPFWNRSISLAPREALGMYLEKKCMTGERSNDLTYEAFLRNIDEYKWEPPLANHCLILPRN